MKIATLIITLLAWSISASADDSDFSKYLFPKFQTKGCTACHDYFEKELKGLSFGTHKGRSPETCVLCHSQDITGFQHEDEWFTQPGLYTSGMNAQQTCEASKSAVNAKFKSKAKLARQLETHLLEDPRVLWGIEGATPQSGILPEDKKEQDLVKDGFQKWKEQVKAWIQGGMKCH